MKVRRSFAGNSVILQEATEICRLSRDWNCEDKIVRDDGFKLSMIRAVRINPSEELGSDVEKLFTTHYVLSRSEWEAGIRPSYTHFPLKPIVVPS